MSFSSLIRVRGERGLALFIMLMFCGRLCASQDFDVVVYGATPRV